MLIGLIKLIANIGLILSPGQRIPTSNDRASGVSNMPFASSTPEAHKPIFCHGSLLKKVIFATRTPTHCGSTQRAPGHSAMCSVLIVCASRFGRLVPQSPLKILTRNPFCPIVWPNAPDRPGHTISQTHGDSARFFHSISFHSFISHSRPT